MAPKRSTIKDVAKRAGVSTATVSNVFSGSKPVNAELRERVEGAARALSYHVDRAASQLRSGQTKVVGVLVPDLDDVFFTSLVSRLEVRAQEDGYDVIVASSRDNPELERSRLRALLGWRPSGLIAVPNNDEIPQILADEAHRLPIVLADRVAGISTFADAVTIDNHEAGAMAASHLVALGHRDVVIAASHLSFAPIRERVRGADSVLFGEFGEGARVVELGSNSDRGADIFADWLDRNARPTAILALTNVTTLAVLSALAARRIDLPEQISLIGFDDYAWMSARKTALTAVRQPVDAMAGMLWDRLKARIGGDDSPPRRIELNTSLQVRDSVRDLSMTANARPVLPRKHAPVPGE
ncbi:LacI family DNA-binding transcriptional regulator [Microvirga antarctica]|uniref:LacI family DNA-binding transcriptional regulator n=1 Tax=Microvirga antarctica TaxID=2819233 RepID=UPI001B312985|nr:LacI family DNA-binding transcriptional regulator [Microvirga antarctica]